MEDDPNQPPAVSPLFSDRSTRKFNDDTLGRKGFIRAFWRALRNHEASEAVVIGVQAAWGDGKTSFKPVFNSDISDVSDVQRDTETR